MQVKHDPPQSHIEEGSLENLVGFADFAKFIATSRGLARYKSFAELSARNLLYMQAQLQFLGEELEKYDQDDRQTLLTGKDEALRNDVESCARTWGGIVNQSATDGPRARRRLELIKEMRELIKEYEEALLRRSQILSLSSEDTPAKATFMSWFWHVAPLRNEGLKLLDNENDMVALSTAESPDRISRFVIFCLQRFRDKSHTVPPSWGSFYFFKVAFASHIAALIAVMIAAALLIGAIVGLYYVTDVGKLLAIVAACTAGFAAVVGLLTNAKRVEIFAATAAYAAVLVVFVGEKIKNS